MSSDLGIIMLSAKTQEMDKVTGLLVGADDYVTKPFSPSELMARVDAVYRRVEMTRGLRKGDSSSDSIIHDEFELNLRNRTLLKNGEMISLDTIEKLKDEKDSVVCFMSCAYVDKLIDSFKNLIK